MEHGQKVHEKGQKEIVTSSSAIEQEMEEQLSKEGWRFAADAARITDEKTSRQDRKHT